MKRLTQINCIASGILWFIGFLVLLFNLLGLWAPWHLAGFAYLFIMWVPLAISVTALKRSVQETDKNSRKTYVLRNGIVLAISVVMSVLTLFVFSTWFW